MKSFVFQGAVASSLLSYALAQSDTYPDYCYNTECQSYGIDFQNGGTYFQNIASTSPFTALETFTGCQNDTSYNVLIDPDGYQYECTMTNMQPDSTPELTTCPLNKNQLWSGDWSVLVYSNNGNCQPINFERDFVLNVATQATLTVTPTVIVTNVYTPVATFTTTITSTVNTTAPAKTTTVASSVKTQTVTSQPPNVLTTVTKALVTVVSTVQSAVVTTITKTATATCSKQATSKKSDITASTTATVISAGKMLAMRNTAAEPTAIPYSNKFKRAILEGRSIEDDLRKAFVAERHSRLAASRVGKRAPDDPTVTSTAPTASLTTYTSTAPTVSITGTTVLMITSTIYPTVTVKSGVSSQVVTVTAVAKTVTNLLIQPATTTTRTVLTTKTVTALSTTTPSAMATSCTNAGGSMV